MKFRVIIFCVLVFCSQIVVPFPFEEEEVRQSAHQTNGWPVEHVTPGQYHHTNLARTHNAPPAHHQSYIDNFGTHERNYDNYESNSHARAPTKERQYFRNPINRPHEFDHPSWRPHNQFANLAPLLPEAKIKPHGGAGPSPAHQVHFSPPGERPYRNIDRNSNFHIPRTHQRDIERPYHPRREHYLNRGREHIRPVYPHFENPIPNNSPPLSGFNGHYAAEPVVFAEAGFPHDGISTPLPVHEPNPGNHTKDIPASSSPVRRTNPLHFSGYDKPFELKPEASGTGFSRDIIPKHPRFPVDHRGHLTTRGPIRDFEDIPVQHKTYVPPPEFTEHIGRKSDLEYPHETVAKPHRVPNYHQGHHHKDIEENIKKILESNHKRFVIVHTNGTVEHLDKLDPATQHNPNSHTIYARPDGTIEYEDHNGRINPEDHGNDKRDDHDNNNNLKKVFDPVSEKHPTDNMPDDHDSNRDITKLIDPIPEKNITDDKPHDDYDNHQDLKNKTDPVPESHTSTDHHDENHKHDLKNVEKLFETILDKIHADDFVPNHQGKMAEMREHVESIHDPLKNMDFTTVSTLYHSENSPPPYDSIKSHDEIITIPPEEMSTDNVKDINTVTESVAKPDTSAINATQEVIKTLTTETPTHQNDNLNKSAIISTQSITEEHKVDLNVIKDKETVDVNNITLTSDSELVSKDTTEVNDTNFHITDYRQTSLATTAPEYYSSVANNSKFENSSSFLGSTHVTDNYPTTTTTSAPEHYDTITNPTTLINSPRSVDHIFTTTTSLNYSDNQKIDYNTSFVRPGTNDSSTKVDDHDITDDSVTVTTSSPLPSDGHTVGTTTKTSTISPGNSTLDSKHPKDVTITLSIPANNEGDTVSVSVDIPPEDDTDDHSDHSEDETLVVNISTKNTTETRSAKSCASNGNQNSDKNVIIDLSVTQEKPVIWVRTTDENILDKLSTGNDKVVYFFNVGPQALVNRDTIRTVFENGTTVIDVTETIYEHKDDKTPKVVKTTQIINS